MRATSAQRSRARAEARQKREAGNVVVVGRGALGRSLASALSAEMVAGRDPLPPGWPDRDQPQIILMALPDGAIAEVAEYMAHLPPATGTAFAHLSGALGLDALRPLAAAGFEVGSIHPLQTFPGWRPPTAFRGIRFAVDSSSETLLERLEILARQLGGLPIRVRDGERALYHAAAVLASNDVVALAALASSVLAVLGWTAEDALQGLLPLMRGAIESLEQRGLPGALSGPVRRGDVTAVRRHLDALALAGARSALKTYRDLGLSALELSRELGLDMDRACELELQLTGVQA